jgi:amino acid adenylation domain-containing protein
VGELGAGAGLTPMGASGSLGFRLSPEQRHLWALQQAEPAVPYAVQGAILIEGDLRSEALEEAVGRVVARHEILRTCFRRRPGTKTAFQVVGAAYRSWRVVDLTPLNPPAQEAQVDDLLRLEGARPFDVSEEPPLRVALFRLANDRHVLLVTLPALCGDGGTLVNLVRELARAYSVGTGGPAPADEPLQYADLAEWQSELLEATDDSARLGRSHWERGRASASAGPRLPFERSGAADGALELDSVALPVERWVVDALEAAAGREDASPAVYLLTCWLALLWRLDGGPQPVVGHLCDGRRDDALREALGPLTRCVPVRLRFAEGLRFGDVLRDVQRAADAGGELLDYLDESLGAVPSVGFEFAGRRHREAGGGLSFSLWRQRTWTHPFRIKLTWFDSGAAALATLDYDRRVYARDDVVRLAGYLECLIRSTLRSVETPVEELELLTPSERDRLVVEFNRTAAPYPADLTIHELVEAQARRRPEAVAVVGGGERLTYAELNARANQIAHWLRAQGIGADTRVGLCVERSVHMVVGLLGVLKAGGAYVPLSADHPPARLAHQLRETGTPVVITQGGLRDRLPAFDGTVLDIDRVEAGVASFPTTDPDRVAAPDHLAYVIYTSGSTGVPKGVGISHRSLVNYTHFITQRLKVDQLPEDGGLQFATVSTLGADLGNTCIFPALVSGGTLHVVSYEDATDGGRFADYVSRHQIDVLKITPSHLGALMAASDGAAPFPRRYLILGGEVFPMGLLEQITKRPVTCEVINHYGPTETTVGSLTFEARDAGRLAGACATVPIGSPIANTVAYVLDRQLRPTPIGVPGELVIGGLGVARGYLGQPGQTGERFVPNPFGVAGFDRLYRTGDLARRLPDGSVEFLGRVDDQVKIRGFRVETAEVEAGLSRHPAVRQSVVAVAPDAAGEACLVAYVVADGKTRPREDELRLVLREWLPEYMLPSAYIFLDALPLTPNGKVDKRALPPPDRLERGPAQVFVAPRTPVEERLADIWRIVLRLDRVGVHDNLFELGAHSLLAMKVVSRLRDAFGVNLPVRSLFEAPTIAALAQRVEGARRGEVGEEAPPVRPATRTAAVPLSFAQQRLWFLDQLDPGTPTYNQTWGVRLGGLLQPEMVQRSLDRIVARHEVLRTTFTSVEGAPTQVIGAARPIEFRRVDLADRPGAEQESILRDELRREVLRPFDLQNDLMVRALLVRLAPDNHVLLVTFHHIASDAWSLEVFERELSELYTAFVIDREPVLPPLSIQYADYAIWQRQWLQGETLESQLAYWKKQLNGDLPVLEMPTDRVPSRIQEGAKASIVLPKTLVDGLRALGRQEDASLFMTLLAAFQTLLSRYTEQEDIIVGSPISGRDRTELEGLIGLFLNTLVIRTDLAGDPTFQELLRRVREVTLGTYTHQSLPFEKLVEELHPERDLTRHPIFDVWFNFVNDTGRSFRLPGITVSGVDVPESWPKFAMALHVREFSASSELSLNLVYRPSLFAEERMVHLLDQFRELLVQIVAEPRSRIRRYSLVTPTSRSMLPDPTEVLLEPRYEHVTDMFLSWAKLTPEHAAISWGSRTWSYQDLAESTEVIARSLVSRGLRPGTVVAVTGHRSFGLIASMMAVFLSGGVLLTVDPELPDERQRQMLGSAGAKFALLVGDDRGEQGRLLKHLALTVIEIDGETGQPAGGETTRRCERPFPSDRAGDDRAYIFFTSGSTGTPKGILGCHQGLSHFLTWQRETFAVRPGDRSAQLTSLSFDALLRDVFLPLVSGATLCLPEERDDLGADRVLPWLERERITILHTVPALARSWVVDHPGTLSVRTLRVVFFSGEPLTEALVRRWRAMCPRAEIVNLYGPTETTMTKCFYRVPAEPSPGVQPVGGPMPHSQALVLAQTSRLCGVGEPGEIVIRTPFGTLGYINASDEDRRRFTRNPFRDDERDVLYLTGDVGRYRVDGLLEILGRRDGQVKIRGMRIELGEIEAGIAEHRGVKESVVVQEDVSGDKRLIAYVVARGAEAPGGDALRILLRRRFPECMVPWAFVFLKALPLMPNGKVDRRALPRPEGRPEVTTAYVAPRTLVEEQVARIWAELLGVDRVGVDDDFFDLGGHSLLAMRVVVRVRKALEVDLSIRSLFEASRLGAFAERIEAATRAETLRLVEELENLSDEEAQRLVEAEGSEEA